MRAICAEVARRLKIRGNILRAGGSADFLDACFTYQLGQQRREHQFLNGVGQHDVAAANRSDGIIKTSNLVGKCSWSLSLRFGFRGNEAGIKKLDDEPDDDELSGAVCHMPNLDQLTFTTISTFALVLRVRNYFILNSACKNQLYFVIKNCIQFQGTPTIKNYYIIILKTP